MRPILLVPVVILALVGAHERAAAKERGLLVFASTRTEGDYGANVEEFPNLFALRPDGSGLRRVTTAAELERDPEWSPNGRRIVFARGVESDCHGGLCDIAPVTEIWVTDAAGRRERRLTSEPSPITAPGQEYQDRSPTWSPEGKRIAFAHLRTFDLSETDGIYLIEADGRGFRRISPELHGASSLDWSPDGRTIAFAAYSALGLLDVESGEVTYRGEALSASWSPDGREVAVCRANGIFLVPMRPGARARRVVAMTSESTRPKALSPCSGISWSPDGRQLAFSAIQRDRASLGGTGRTNPLDLFIVDVDGGRPKRITGNPYGDEAPDWRP